MASRIVKSFDTFRRHPIWQAGGSAVQIETSTDNHIESIETQVEC